MGAAKRRGSLDERVRAASGTFVPGALPLKLYKYTERKWAEQLIVDGGTRIGTLLDYRKTEHGAGISDPNEGFGQLSGHIRNLNLQDGTVETKALETLGIISGIGGKIENVKIDVRRESANCHIWCFSTRRSAATMRLFDGADTCVEVFDPKMFFHAITNAVLRAHPSADGLVVAPITYNDRVEIWNGVGPINHPAFYKSVEYKDQCEGRAVVNRLVPTADAIYLARSDASKYCRIVDVY